MGKLEEETGREERPDACEEAEEEEEVRVESRGPGSSKEEGMQSHVSRSENLEKLNISRTLQDKHGDSKQQHQNTTNIIELIYSPHLWMTCTSGWSHSHFFTRMEPVLPDVVL